MKQGTQSTMLVELKEVNLEEIESVEFIFKRSKIKDAPAVKKCTYPSDITLADGLFAIPWTVEETYKIPSRTVFFMDTRIHLNNTTDMPETPIVTLVMDPTLFKEGE